MTGGRTLKVIPASGFHWLSISHCKRPLLHTNAVGDSASPTAILSLPWKTEILVKLYIFFPFLSFCHCGEESNTQTQQPNSRVESSQLVHVNEYGIGDTLPNGDRSGGCGPSATARKNHTVDAQELSNMLVFFSV